MRRSRVRIIALLVIGITFALGIQVVTQSGSLAVWDMPYASAFPGGLALGADGTVFVAASGGREVYRLDPANNVYHSWGVGVGPEDVTVVDGVVFCAVGEANILALFDPAGMATSSAVVPFPDVRPGEIHRGEDTDGGNIILWMAERGVPGVLRFEYDPTIDALGVFGEPSDQDAPAQLLAIEPQIVTTAYERFSYDVTLLPPPFPLTTSRTSFSFTDWALPLDDFEVQDIAVAHDGTLWISFGAPTLFQFDPVAGTLQEMETIQNVAIFQGLLPAADGSIWFGNIVEGSIGHFNPAIGLSEVWRIPGTEEVYDLAFDEDGGIWYTDRVGDAIGRLNVLTGEATIYPLRASSEPLYLAVGADGDVWFTAGSGNYIGRLTPAD